MSNLIPWEPFAEMTSLRDVLDRMFDQAFVRPFAASTFALNGLPTLDLYQTHDQVVLKAALPGVQPEDIQISVTNGVLNLRGEVHEDQQDKTHTYLIRERCFGSFQRSLTLPTHVNVDQAQATFEDGLLVLTLPKAEQAKPKSITVKAKK